MRSTAFSRRCAAISVSVSETRSWPVALELVAQLGEVLDDAVVHHRDAALLAEVRVGVDVVGGAVGGPAGVADAGRGRPAAAAPRSPSRGWPSLPARLSETIVAAVDESDAGGVVAAVLQTPESLDHDVARLLVADVPHDPAHGAESRRARTPLS